MKWANAAVALVLLLMPLMACRAADGQRQTADDSQSSSWRRYLKLHPKPLNHSAALR